MKRSHRIVKFMLELWGEHKRRSLSVLGYPKSVPAFDPGNYEYKNKGEPCWKRKHIDQKAESKFRRATQRTTRPAIKGRVPNYMANTRASKIDVLVNDLPAIYQEVARLKFIFEMKDGEIAKALNKHVKTIEKRTDEIYQRLTKKVLAGGLTRIV